MPVKPLNGYTVGTESLGWARSGRRGCARSCRSSVASCVVSPHLVLGKGGGEGWQRVSHAARVSACTGSLLAGEAGVPQLLGSSPFPTRASLLQVT